MAAQLPGHSPGRRAAGDAEDDGFAIHQRSELLRRCGFQQSEVSDPDTRRPALMWVRVWRGVRDAVIANSDGALAYRVWDADFDPRKPFLVEKDITLWSAVGSFLQVSEQLLTQGAPLTHSHFTRRTARQETDNQSMVTAPTGSE